MTAQRVTSTVTGTRWQRRLVEGRPVALAGIVLLLAGCASGPRDGSEFASQDLAAVPVESSSLPDWVANPGGYTGSVASVECVPWSGNYAIDRTEAVAMARADLVKKIELRVQALDKTYLAKTRTSEGASVGGVFETASKQFTERTVAGSDVSRVDLVDIEGINHLCSLVAITQEEQRALFDTIWNEAGKVSRLDPMDDAVMWEEFRAEQLQQELDDLTR